MSTEPKFDFSGYATKNDLKCADGRVIIKDAFKHNDGKIVPLVWQHLHNEPANILGHVLLENREDGVYAYGKFNDTPAGKNTKELVAHGDITALSIFANDLKQKGTNVLHGAIREVSLVLSGANPEALIDNISFSHSDGTYDVDDSEAIIYTGLDFDRDSQNGSKKAETVAHAAETVAVEVVETEKKDKTVQEVLDSLNEEQQTVVYGLIASVAEGDADFEEENLEHSNSEGETTMKQNVFDNEARMEKGPTLSHDQIQTIMTDAKKLGSLKDAVLAHAGTYGIDDIDVLFPDARTVRPTPDLIKRDDSWVSVFMAETQHSPFSRIKSTAADLTEDEARAKGYITGKKKIDEVFPVMKRVTTPTTVYKKQKLDRDDIVDITDFDVVSWLKAEMRMMLDEEVARAALIGDGRLVTDESHINPENIRPIWTDDALYSHKVQLPLATTTVAMIDEIIKARKFYKGTGVPSFYTTTDVLTEMLLVKDSTGRRLYNTIADLVAVLRVSKIVEVEVMEGAKRTSGADELGLIGIMVNPRDYTLGADKGGQIAMFDDFDIDYNQYKYLIETRCSGALTRPKSAVVIEKIVVDG